MSMHFAPQWVKPIKPTGTALTPIVDPTPAPIKPVNTFVISPNVPFPALSQGQYSASPTNATTAREPSLSYSRATHTSVIPTSPTDGTYLPNGETNGIDHSNPHPFRYSREQILGLWDEDKVKDTPIELEGMLDSGGVVVSDNVAQPVGLREMTEVEKKLLATSIHPPPPTRRPMSTTVSGITDPPFVNGLATRRSLGPSGAGRDPVSMANGRATGFGGFGRGEGGALAGHLGAKPGATGSGMMSSGVGDGRMHGSIGGIGGVGKRLGRGRTESTDTSDTSRSAAAPWRPMRTTSGSFEGVLGFGSSIVPSLTTSDTHPAPSDSASPQTPNISAPIETTSSFAPVNGWAEKVAEGERERPEIGRDNGYDLPAFGVGGGPGWGSGQKKWRLAAGLPVREPGDRVGRPEETNGSGFRQPMHTLNTSELIAKSMSESIVATASGTPVPERDATVDNVSASSQTSQTGVDVHSTRLLQQSPADGREDLGAVQWYYRDPGGQEQGPFTGSQMHDWYTHPYLTDDLPVRREHENTFHTLAELKTFTANAVQPFLSPVRPRLPPNLPIPRSALQAIIGAAATVDVADSIRHLSMNSPPITSPPSDHSISPERPPQYIQQAFALGYNDDRNAVFSSNRYTPQTANHPFHSPPAPSFRSPGQGWGSIATHNIAPRLHGDFGSVGRPSPIGSTPISHPQSQSIYSPINGGSNDRGLTQNSLFSPSLGVGAVPSSPWGIPQQSQGIPEQQQYVHQQISPMPTWQPAGLSIEPPKPSVASTVEDHLYEQLSGQIGPDTAMEEEAALEPEAEELGATGEEELGSSLSETAFGTPEQELTPPSQVSEPTIAPKTVVAIPSAWGQKPTAAVNAPSNPVGRKLSLIAPASAQLPPAPASSATTAPSFKLPPAPASLPPKPVTVRHGSISEATKFAGPNTPEKAPMSTKSAPWAVTKEDKEAWSSPAGPSIREIQEAEAKQAEIRKHAVAESRAATGSPAQTPSDEKPQSMTWGLPSQGQKTSVIASPTATSSSSTPVWGGGESGPKKTLKQIQEEEESRKARLAAQARATQAATGAAAGSKRGYADLAATTSLQPAAGWTTVGSSGKTNPPAAIAPARSIIPSKPAITIPVSPVTSSPTTPSIVAKIVKANGNADDIAAPSVDFIRWTKQALTGLTLNIDEFIQMLLTLPIDAPAPSRAETLEIISDSVYANSSTLDGRRFAQEFYTRRKADAMRTGAKPVAKISSLADVVKTMPKSPASDAGFKVVKAKGKKKT